MKKYPSVSVIFPNFNGGKEPLECLRSITRLDYPKNKLDFIVIDNASTDGSSRKIKKYFPEVILLQQTENLGFARAVNLGINKSTGEFLLIVNDDIVLSRNCLHKFTEYYYNHEDTGVLTGKIFSKKNPRKLVSAGCRFNRFTGGISLLNQPDQIQESEWAPGCAMFIPRKIINRIGLFDTEFPHFFEDFDLCLRINNSGKKIIYLPDAVFYHGESTTGNRNKPDKYYKWYQSKIRFIIKNLPFFNIASILFIQLFIIMPLRTIILRDGRFWPFIKGLRWNIVNINNPTRRNNPHG